MGLGFLAQLTILDIDLPPRAESLPGPRALVAVVSEARKRARRDEPPSQTVIRTALEGAPRLGSPARASENLCSLASISQTPAPSTQSCWSFTSVTHTVVLSLKKRWGIANEKLFTDTCSVCGLQISPTSQSPWRMADSKVPSDIHLITGQLQTGSDVQNYAAHPECATQLRLCRPGVPPARAWDL